MPKPHRLKPTHTRNTLTDDLGVTCDALRLASDVLDETATLLEKRFPTSQLIERFRQQAEHMRDILQRHGQSCP